MYSGSEAFAQHGDGFIMSESLNAVHDNTNLNPLSRAQTLHWRPTECKGMYPMIRGAQFVHVANQPFNIVAVVKALLKLKRKLILVF